MIEKLLRLSCFFVFLGRGYEHIFFDSPYRALFWDEDLLKPVITTFSSYSWHEYVTSPYTDFFIEKLILIIGVFYILCAYISLTVLKDFFWKKRILLLGSFSMLGLSFLNYKEHFFQIGQLFELTVQWSSGIFLIYFLNHDFNIKNIRVIFSIKLAVGLTFLGHGLYALGFHPTPGKFLDMIIIITGLGEDQSLSLLKIAGLFDIFVFSFCNLKFLDKFLFSFAAIWGGLTSFARVGSSLFLSFSLSSFHSSMYETIFRLPHLLFPLICLILCSKKTDKPNSL